MSSRSPSLGTILNAALRSLAETHGVQLVKRMPMDALAAHADAYPARPLHNMFLEWELRDGEFHLAGYGHGFRHHDLSALLASDRDGGFSDSLTGRRILEALRHDPFDPTGVRCRSLQDREVEWIEYDVQGDHIAEHPGIFFPPPQELRLIHDHARLRDLLDRLSLVMPELREAPRETSLLRFLEELGQAELSHGTLLRAYRLGRSQNRAPGWLRMILGGLRPESLDTIAPAFFGRYDADHTRAISAVTSANEHPRITASIDVIHGQMSSIDIEGPYSFSLRSAAMRTRRIVDFCAELINTGRIPPESAQALYPLGVVRFELPEHEHRGLLLLNHYKAGVSGRQRGRLKLYAELILRHNSLKGPEIGE